MPRKSKTLDIGDIAPGFTLPDGASGEPITLEGLKKPLVIIFGRGTW